MFVGVLKAIKGGKIEVEQKKSFLPDIHRVNMGLRGLGCGQYKRTTFKGFLCIFLKILAKDMEKPLVPADQRHLGHLGHPTFRDKNKKEGGFYILSAVRTDAKKIFKLDLT